jgi:hypothetical protein
MALRIRRQGEKSLERALARTDAGGSGRWRKQETIDEGEEPPPTPQVAQVRQPHQRERAEVGM